MFKHDCDKCVLLAEEVVLNYDTYDMYVCLDKAGPRFDSLVARFGNEGSEYLSYHPSDIILSAANGLLQGLWREYHNVRGAGDGFVDLGDGTRVSFR